MIFYVIRMMKAFQILKKSQKTKKRRSSRELVFETRADDVFLVSFPKSGNTWLRFILGYYYYPETCSFNTIDALLPDIHYNPDAISGMSERRFIKSHFPYSKLHQTEKYSKVVYVVRDGRDVMVSYYFYLKRGGVFSEDISFEDALVIMEQATLFEYSNWSMHVESWLTSGHSDLHLIRYEDLLDDPLGVAMGLFEFIGDPADPGKLQEALAQSDFKSLREKEEKMNDFWRGKPADPSIRFIRKGRKRDWENHFSEQQARQFYERNKKLYTRLGYEF